MPAQYRPYPWTKDLNYVWEVATLDWVAMTQPSSGGGGDATAANQVIGNASLAAIETSTDSIDDKTPALVSGRVPVDGSGVTQPVSGPVTDAQARAYQTATGTINGNGQSVTLALNGASGASASFIDSAFDGTVRFYASVDGGTQFIEIQAINVFGNTGGATIANQWQGIGVVPTRIWNFCLTGGETHVRVTSVSGSSGSVAVTLKANDGAPNPASLAICPTEEGDYGRPVGGVLMMVRNGASGMRSPRMTSNRYEGNQSSLITLSNIVTTNNLAVDTTVADSATSVQLLAQNLNRVQAYITNTSTAALYVKLGSTASATSFAVRLVQNATFEVPQYWVGVVSGIWASDPGDGVAVIQEIALV